MWGERSLNKSFVVSESLKSNIFILTEYQKSCKPSKPSLIFLYFYLFTTYNNNLVASEKQRSKMDSLFFLFLPRPTQTPLFIMLFCSIYKLANRSLNKLTNIFTGHENNSISFQDSKYFFFFFFSSRYTTKRPFWALFFHHKLKTYKPNLLTHLTSLWLSTKSH